MGKFYNVLFSILWTNRLLVRKARKIAVQYNFNYHEPIPVSQLVQKIAAVMQEYTQSGWVRSVKRGEKRVEMCRVGCICPLIFFCIPLTVCYS